MNEAAISSGPEVAARKARRSGTFYFSMALIFVAIAFAGFAPTYFVPLAADRFAAPVLVHIHGLLFFGWTILLLLQTRLVGRGRIELHRAFGLVGISLATAMLFTGVALIVHLLGEQIAAGQAAAGRAGAIVAATQIAMFVSFFVIAIANLRRADVHKRAMLLATVNLMNAAAGRLVLALEALTAGMSIADFRARATAAETLLAGVGGALVVDLLILVMITHDWRARGRPHRLYVIGGACVLAVQVVRVPLAQTAIGHALTNALLSLAP
jgi:hypothetical protein